MGILDNNVVVDFPIRNYVGIRSPTDGSFEHVGICFPRKVVLYVVWWQIQVQNQDKEKNATGATDYL